MVGGQQSAHAQCAGVRSTTAKARRGCRQVQHRAPQDDGGFESRGERSVAASTSSIDDGAAQPVGTVRAAARALADRAGMMVSPKAPQADSDKFGAKPSARTVPLRRARRAGPHGRRTLSNYWNKGEIHFDRIVYLPIVGATMRLATSGPASSISSRE
jgi:hypothetical protein